VQILLPSQVPRPSHPPRRLSLYDSVRELPLEVESYALDRLEHPISPEFTRVTTVIRLRGRGEEGVGEDVTYHETAHPPPADLPLAGSHTLDSYSDLVEGQSLFSSEPEMAAFQDYRRWAFESAALDLALRQAGRPLASAVGREPQPVRFVVSMGLGDPPSTAKVRGWLEHYPELRFKLDPRSSWTEEIVAELAELACVDSVDLKGQYEGTVVDQPADARLYQLLVDVFPEAWIEDPAITDETRPILEAVADRVTWDAVIHSVEDIEALPWEPRSINIKPSRFGKIERLFDTYDHCEAKGISPYGGGQFELGPGRGQIQYLASLFHADAPNDVAPKEFNIEEPRSGLPAPPLEPSLEPTGFRWG
jgi:L-alanine-DL-glutamate epimerase-like enolase superfamily enzyme